MTQQKQRDVELESSPILRVKITKQAGGEEGSKKGGRLLKRSYTRQSEEVSTVSSVAGGDATVRGVKKMSSPPTEPSLTSPINFSERFTQNHSIPSIGGLGVETVEGGEPIMKLSQPSVSAPEVVGSQNKFADLSSPVEIIWKYLNSA